MEIVKTLHDVIEMLNNKVSILPDIYHAKSFIQLLIYFSYFFQFKLFGDQSNFLDFYDTTINMYVSFLPYKSS